MLDNQRHPRGARAFVRRPSPLRDRILEGCLLLAGGGLLYAIACMVSPR